MTSIAEKHISRINSLKTQGASVKYIAEVLDQIASEFDISLLISTSPNFKPEILFQYIEAVLPYYDVEQDELVDAIYRFFDRLLPVLISYSSSTFVKLSSELIGKSTDKKIYHPLLRYISAAVSLQSAAKQEENVKLCLELLKLSNEKELSLQYPLLFQMISKYCVLDDVIPILDSLKTSQLAVQAANLCMYKSPDLVPIALRSDDSQYLIPFLQNCKPKEQVNVTEFINFLTTSKDTALVAVFLASQFVYTEETVEAYKNLCQKLSGELAEAQGIDKSNLLMGLASASSKGYFDASLLKDEVNFNSMSKDIKVASVHLYIANLYDDYQTVFEQIYTTGGLTLRILIDAFYQAAKKIYTLDRDWAVQFTRKLINYQKTFDSSSSSSQNEPLYLPLLKTLAVMPRDEELVPDVNKLLTLVKDTTDYNCATYVFRVCRRYRLQFQVTDLDWFENTRCSFEILRSPEVPFVSELLHSGLIPAQAMRAFLRGLRVRPRAAGEALFRDILSLAKMIAKTVSYEIDPDNLVESISWIDQDSIDKLLATSKGPVSSSGYGGFASEVARTLSSLYHTCADVENEGICLVILRYLLLFGSSFPDTCIPFAIDIVRTVRSDATEQLLGEFLSLEIPHKFSPFVFRCVNEVKGLDEAMKLDPQVILQAVRYDREIASLIADRLDQPLEPLRTFLSFVGIDKHSEWVDKCQREIPVDEWILTENDRFTIENELPTDDTTREIHELALARIDTGRLGGFGGITPSSSTASLNVSLSSPSLQISRNMSTSSILIEDDMMNDINAPANMSILAMEPDYEAEEQNEIPIPKAPKSHTYEDANLPNLLSFLWHSPSKLANETEVLEFFENEWDTIESDKHKDKLLLGILCYCDRNKIKLNEEKVADRINGSGLINILAGVVFFKNLQFKLTDLPQHISDCVSRVLTEINVDREKIVETYINYKTTPFSKLGIRRSTFNLRLLLLESIIGMDKDLKRQIQDETEEQLIERLKQLPNLSKQKDPRVKNSICFALSLFFDFYFKPNGMRLFHRLPTNYDWPTLAFSFSREDKGFSNPKIAQPVRESLMELIKSNSKRYTSIMQWLNPTGEEMQQIHTGWTRWRFLFPCLFFKDSTTFEVSDDLRQYFMLMPPSYPRRFSRSLFVNCAPQIPQKFFEEVKLCMVPVHGGVLPKDSSFLILPAANSLPKDIANAGYPSAISALYKEALGGDILSYTILCRFHDDVICKEIKLSDSTIAKSEVAQKIIMNSISSVRKTIDALTAFKSNISPGDLVAIICNRQLVNSPNFLAVCVAFSMVEKILKNTEYFEMCKAYRDPELSAINDEQKREWFSNLTEEAVTQIIHIPVEEQ